MANPLTVAGIALFNFVYASVIKLYSLFLNSKLKWKDFSKIARVNIQARYKLEKNAFRCKNSIRTRSSTKEEAPQGLCKFYFLFQIRL